MPNERGEWTVGLSDYRTHVPYPSPALALALALSQFIFQLSSSSALSGLFAKPSCKIIRLHYCSQSHFYRKSLFILMFMIKIQIMTVRDYSIVSSPLFTTLVSKGVECLSTLPFFLKK